MKAHCSDFSDFSPENGRRLAAACAQAPISNRQYVPSLNGLPRENLLSAKCAINYLTEWYLFYIFRP